MGSSSSASPPDSSHNCFTYDVFLSFRGVDTRKSFVDHLYTTLSDKGIYTFRDFDSLEPGKPIAQELLQVIKHTRLAIVVFSKNYACSSWCLDELVQIMDCMRKHSLTVYPVFYDVDPSDVRNQKGRFGKAFAEHYNWEKKEIWREALFEASSLTGWDTRKIANGHEAQVIKEVVKRVSLVLRSKDLSVDKNLVGMESRMIQVESSLGIGLGGVRMIGILGMEGAGKTTLAKAIYNQYLAHFEACAFVENVRESSQKFGFQRLQIQILSAALGERFKVFNVSDGLKLMRSRLCYKRILIVFDDVGNVEQLQALAGGNDWFGVGSRIIITTRDKELLEAHRVDKIHEVSLLTDEEAFQLFRKLTPLRTIDAEGYEVLVGQIIRHAAGSPLTLRILGSFLGRLDVSRWLNALESLFSSSGNEKLKDVKMRFDSLDYFQKEIFLDVALLYRGMHITVVSNKLENRGYFATTCLRVLEEKSLIGISNDKLYVVHDDVVEMAERIVLKKLLQEPWKQGRLKDRKEVKRKKVTEATKTMAVNISGKEGDINLAEASRAGSPPTRRKYDVFLNFRGEDTRETFVEELYKALTAKRVYTFKDDKTLKRGKVIAQELLRAIDQSKCAIVVFSQNYATSSWCLDELVQIMECMHKNSLVVLPVFYSIDPSDVRKQKGHFWETLARHKTERDKAWRDAILEASNLSGWGPDKIANQRESQCIEEIVKWVSQETHRLYPGVDENLIGMESRLQNLKSCLGIGSGDVSMLGIWGMGGGGKTTLARALFGEISIEFANSVFVGNVGEVTRRRGLEHVQKQLLSAVDKDLEVNDVSQGMKLISSRLCGEKILVVLDGVDHQTQLEGLAGKCTWFGSGSKIIITTREKQILVAHKAIVHSVSLLKEEEAIELFYKYAFWSNIPLNGFEELSKQVVSYAAGLPLTLKVLGSSLCGQDSPIWRSALDKLKEVPENETMKKLEISYDSLDYLQKEMFLKIVCLYKGTDINLLSMILDSCGYYATVDLNVLEKKCLLTVSGENRCEVHDMVVELAKDIVRREHPDKPWKRSLLWCPDEFLDVLKNNRGTQKIKALVVNMIGKEDNVNIAEAFKKMKSLRLLHISYASKLSFQGPNHLPETLRVLYFEDYPLEYLPETFEGINLVKLVLTGRHITGLQNAKLKGFKNLKFLTIDGSEKLLVTPDFTSTPNLEAVAIRSCPNLVNVHSSIGFLGMLKSLELYNLTNLIELPLSVGDLHDLVLLDLSFCSSLKTLPDSLSELKYLKTLNLKYCSSLQKLPENIGRSDGLDCLETLDLQRCSSLCYLPHDIGRLPRLANLLLLESALKEIPDSICLLNCLKTLDFTGVTELQSLPNTLHEAKLETLILSHCYKIEHLPESICRLKSLRTLTINSCSKLKELPSGLGCIECLEELRITKCNIKRLPDSICGLKRLKILELTDCFDLKELPAELCNLESLGQTSREMLQNAYPEFK